MNLSREWVRVTVPVEATRCATSTAPGRRSRETTAQGRTTITTERHQAHEQGGRACSGRPGAERQGELKFGAFLGCAADFEPAVEKFGAFAHSDQAVAGR